MKNIEAKFDGMDSTVKRQVETVVALLRASFNFLGHFSFSAEIKAACMQEFFPVIKKAVEDLKTIAGAEAVIEIINENFAKLREETLEVDEERLFMSGLNK